jgi:hypothetical protein
MRRALLAGCTVLAVCGFATPATAPTSTLTAVDQHQLVPAYFWPEGSNATNPWHILCRTMRSGSIAIVDPNVGPGVRQLPNFTDALSYCHRREQKVIGYVSTDYATRPLAQTLSDIDKYYRWYDVDGIFLDEMSNFPAGPAADGLTIGGYYQRVYQHIKAKTGRGRYVVGNPGAPAASAWQLTRPVADKIVVFEDTASVYLSRTPPDWVLRRPANQIGALVKSASASQRHQICVTMRARNEAWIDVTNDHPPNTWDTLAPYWSDVAPRCP